MLKLMLTLDMIPPVKIFARLFFYKKNLLIMIEFKSKD